MGDDDTDNLRLLSCMVYGAGYIQKVLRREPFTPHSDEVENLEMNTIKQLNSFRKAFPNIRDDLLDRDTTLPGLHNRTAGSNNLDQRFAGGLRNASHIDNQNLDPGFEDLLLFLHFKQRSHVMPAALD